jgi:DNA-binding response OmpR family regulator
MCEYSCGAERIVPMSTTCDVRPNGLRILVVEDEFLVADDIAEAVRELGYEVVGPAATTAEALSLLEDGPLHGALLDANLDGTSSASIAEKLRERRIPFVVVTGYGGLLRDSQILEAAPRVTKPFAARELVETLTTAFAR